ncbi:MAG: COX15/CtaA family protein [Leeuwenhoekiella sp.]
MYRKSIVVSLVLVYLVIIAGAVVRMTGSGMGCPDWPKCFGYIIPPTEEGQLEWQPDHSYEKGQVIIVDKSLLVAKNDFTSRNNFDTLNWNSYDKHDYAVFNPWHTWIEYINRLLGALAGLAVLAMALISVIRLIKPHHHFQLQKKQIALSWVAVFLMGFQGWLGATVVYSVLSPVRITLHMMVALLIVALLIYILFIVTGKETKTKYHAKFKVLMVMALLLTCIQIVLGTQVRQFVDDQVDEVGYTLRGLWLAFPEWEFYVHRSFSIVVVALNVYLLWLNQKFALGHKLFFWIIGLLGVEVLTGILMYYMDFPFLTQPLHLIIAALLFGVQFYVLLLSFRRKAIQTS